MIKSSDFEDRLKVTLFIFMSALGLLWVRLFYLQVVQGKSFRSVAESNRTSLIVEQAPRGLILDKNGVVLADSKPTFVVFYTPIELGDEVFEGVLNKLSSILNIAKEELKRRLQPALERSSLVRVMDRVSRFTAFALAEQQPNLPGVSVVVEMQRRYPHRSVAAHAIGYLGQISERELQKLRADGYQPDSLIGKVGLEKVYDSIIRGQNGGMNIEVDASGRTLKILNRKKPVPGWQIKTTLDLNIQQAAENALDQTGKAGAVVAMDPRNGDILAFASAPSFDPNHFVVMRGQKEKNKINVDEILNREDLPLFNRVIQGMYAPGSIFKIIDIAIAIESKKLKPEDTFHCPGYYQLGGQGGKTFLCWKKKGHGQLSLMDSLVHSCNVYIYQLSLKVGPDMIENLAKKFGLGKLTGLGLPGEKGGSVPGRKMFKTGHRRWFNGDTLNMAIGQGTLLFTPIQAAQFASIVASRGKIYRPKLIKEVKFPNGDLYQKEKPEILGQVNLSQTTWDFLNLALTQVVERGTGRACRIPGVHVAGKTGTAQNPHGDDHAWFIAYAPSENPVIAVAVLVEHGLKGSSAAAPIARRVLVEALKPNATAKLRKESLNDRGRI